MPFDVEGARAAGFTDDQIADEMAAKNGFDAAGARKAGFGSPQIITEISSRMAAPDSSFPSDVKSGTNAAMAALGNAGQAVGSAATDAGYPTVGNALTTGGTWLKSNAPDVPANYQPRSADIMQDLRTGHGGRALGDVAHAIAQGAAPAGAALGAGALAVAAAPEELAGAAGAAGAGLVGGVLGLGEGAGNSAQQAGRAAPNTQDLVRGLPEAALGAATNAVGLSRAVPGGIAGRMLAGGAANAANTAGSAALEGHPLGGDQVINSAIVGAAGAGAAELPGMARAGVKAGSDQLQAIGLPTPSVDAATAQIGVKNDMDATGISSRTRAANNVKANLKSELQTALDNVSDAATDGGADPGDVKAGVRRAKTIITDIAGRHNNEMTLDDRLKLQDALSWAPEEHVDAILRGTQALNSVSDQSIIKNQTGPFQKLGGVVGRYGGIGYELAQGNPMAALAAVGLGHSPVGGMLGRVGQAAGFSLDKLFGTATPQNDLRVIKAASALRDVGIDPTKVGSPLQGLQDLNAQFASPQSVTGLRPSPIPMNTPIQAGPSPDVAAALQQAQALRPNPTVPPSMPSGTPAGRLQQAQALAGANMPPASPQAPGPMPSAIAAANAAARAASQQASPGFKPNTPDEVLSQLAQDGLQAAPDGKLSGTPGWLRYLANGRPDVDMEMALNAARSAEAAGHVMPGTTDALAAHPGGYDAEPLQAIQQHLPPLPGGSAKGHRAAGGAPPVDSTGAPIRNPYAYQGAIKAYQSNVASAAQQAADIGLPDVANALRDIGINYHHASHKEAARAALPEHIRQHIPDWLVKHGGKG